MNLYIMSRGRAGKVTTLASIPESWRGRTYLVVPDAEAVQYAVEHHADCNILPAALDVTNYSQKFQSILDDRMGDGLDKAVILDDDLVFSAREGKSLKTIRDSSRLEKLWHDMEVLLEKYPLVGVHPRAMGQNAPPGYVENGRIICIQGINRRLIGDVHVADHPILADVFLNCALLARGMPNAIITDFFQDHGPCQAPGGCSIYRTSEMQERAIDDLCRLYPGYIKKVYRKPKVAGWMVGEDGTRVEFTGQWKKLYAAAPNRGRA